MEGYDYRQAGMYFVSTCVQGWRACLGEVIEGTMWANEYGNIVEEHWRRLEQQFSYVVLHSFVVMPNEIHAILQIEHKWIPPHAKIKDPTELMAIFKAESTVEIREVGMDDFEWQHAMLEVAILDEESYENISRFIMQKPRSWKSTTPLYEKLEDRSPSIAQNVR